jgi:hypothetical protein
MKFTKYLKIVFQIGLVFTGPVEKELKPSK